MKLTGDFIRERIKTHFGLDEFKTKSSLSFQVLMADSGRKQFLEELETLFSDYGAVYDPDKKPSSIGAVIIEKFSVGAAPIDKQGSKSAGIQNELYFIKTVNDYCSNKPVDISISNGIKSLHIHNVISAYEVGRDTKNRKKSDVNLLTAEGKVIPISLKKDNAQNWESLGGHWAPDALDILENQISKGIVSVEPYGAKRFRLSQSIAKLMPSKSISDIVFGSDILEGNGAVIFKSFKHSDFEFRNNTLHINVSKIYRTPNEIENSEDRPYMLIRNDASRMSSKIKPGIRALAVCEKRIGSKVLIVE